jgi:quercetin dioxygenase-like cupin family protein
MPGYTGLSHRPVPILVKPSQGAEITVMPGVHARVIVPSASVGGAYGIWEMTADPGFSPPRHVHHREDEILHLQSGRLLLWSGGQSWEICPGTTAALPRGVAHSFLVISDTPAKMLMTAVPGGVEAIYAAVAGLDLPEDEAGLIRVGEDFGVQYVAGPISR